MKKEVRTQDVPQDPAGPSLLIVGIGASAGGIEALTAFFEQVPPDSGAAYVVILHLSPDHDSQLTSVLQTGSKIPVAQVTSKIKVKPDHIYILPPNQHLVMEDGHIAAVSNILIEERRAPVDIFFRTLAKTHGDRAVGVILSGTGANGSMGLKRIKELGGAVFVQNPRQSAFNEMGRNAIATGLVDDVLNVEEIPGRILAYRDTLAQAHIEEEPEDRLAEDQQALREIFTQLRLRTGHDFSAYKRATLMRRIERRMAVQAITQLHAYAAYSNERPEETQALLKDLLISVTNFFRDKSPFTALEETVLPAVFEHKSSEDQVRIWVAGCATGEEAYSLAMLCAERTLGLTEAPKVQIFATDIDDAAITIARDGYYTLNDAADVSPDRLARFFTREGDGYRVRREIRETILFASHNFIKDPPFSRIDLVSCRNVLIYLNRPAQERVMETFHFALRAGGYLLLGTSESIDTASDLFKTLNREQHIYQSRGLSVLRSIVVPETVPQLRAAQPAPSAGEKARPAPRLDHSDLHLQLVEQYAPPSLVVDGDFNIVHLSPRAGRYLELAGGEPSKSVLKLITEELRPELRNGLYQAAQKAVPVNSAVCQVRTKEGNEYIRIHIRPIASEAAEERSGHLLVVFEPMIAGELPGEVVAQTSDESAAHHLEEELLRLRSQLRTAHEQHEFQAEELKAGNEELQAMNEELRSATEELETSKEELQSINEELNTVNQELKVKVEEATIISNNLQNLINSTDIGTIFLDRSFRVVLFTPAVRAIFSLIPSDYGRPLADIKSRLREDVLLEDAGQVLSRLQMIEREMESTDRRTFLVRLAPYRTEEDRIQGVVISFVDITERKKAENAVRESELRQQLAISAAELGTYVSYPAEDRWEADNRTLAIFGLPAGESVAISELFEQVIYPDDRPYHLEMVEKALDPAGTGKLGVEVRLLHPDGSVRWVSVSGQTVFEGTPRRAVSMYGTAADITERKMQEALQRESEERQSFLLRLSDELRPLSDPQEIQQAAMRTLCLHLGVSRASYYEIAEDGEHFRVGQSYSALDVPALDPNLRMSSLGFLQLAYKTGHTVVLNDIEKDQRLDEPARAVLLGRGVRASVVMPLLKDGRLFAMCGIHSISPHEWTPYEIAILEETADRTRAVLERARSEKALAESEEKYRTLFNSIDEGFSLLEMIFDENGHVADYWHRESNPAFTRFTGIEHAVGKRMSELMPDLEKEWHRMLEQVCRTGEPIRTEYAVQQLNQWYSCFLSRVGGAGSPFVAAVYDDITERKQQALRQDYLLRLSDLLRSVSEPLSIERTVTGLALDHFGCDLCYLVDIQDHTAIVRHQAVRGDTPSVAGAYPLSDFPVYRKVLNEGRAFVVDDYNDTELVDKDLCAICLRIGVASAINVPVVRDGDAIAIFCLVQSVPRRWTQPEITLAAETAERLWIAIGRARAEEDLVSSEGKYRTLFNSVEEGVCIAELLYDENGNAVDYIFREVNPVFERQTGLSGVVGKRAREVAPNVEQAWIEALDQVVRTGEPLHTEAFFEDPDRWYTISAVRQGRLGSRLVASIFDDITERKRSEANLALLAQISQELVSMVRPEEMLDRLGERIARHLGLSLCLFIEVDESEESATIYHGWQRPGVPRISGTYRISDFTTPGFARALQSGKTVVVTDASNDPLVDAQRFNAFQVGSMIAVPLIRDGKWKCWLGAYRSEKYDWRADEVELMRELTARIWTRVERVRAEEALRLHEQRFRLFVTAASDILYRMSPDWSQMYELEGKGFLADTHTVRSGWDLFYIPEGEKERVWAAIRRAIDTRSMFQLQHQVIRADGSPGWTFSRAIPLLNAEGGIEEWFGAASDITEQQQTDAALSLSEERHRIALQSAEMAAWDWNIARDLVAWNDQHFLLLGLHPDGLLHDSAFFTGRIHPEDAARVKDKLMKAVEQCGVYHAEFRIVRADDGRVRWMSGFGRVVECDEAGRAARMVGVMYDITARKQIEDQKDEFISIASHELRTPVTSIKAYTELLRETFLETDDQRSAEMMGKLNVQVDRLTMLIHSLLDTTQISENKLPLLRTDFLLNEFIVETVEFLQRIAGSQRIEMELGADVTLHADRERLAQVLVNLITNAIRYAPGTDRIVVQSIVEPERVTICIKDFGAGMSEEVQKRIFERFYRGAGAHTHSGLGLGLFICAGIVEAHGGTIHVESREGDGARFCFSIPLHD